MRKRIEIYREIVQTTKIHAPISKLIGMKLVDIKEGEATFELEIKAELMNSVGTLQGGVIGIMADAAMGIAYGSLLNDDQGFSTIEFKINFFRPVGLGESKSGETKSGETKLTAIGKVMNNGKKMGYTECEVFNNQHKIVAKAVGTQINIEK